MSVEAAKQNSVTAEKEQLEALLKLGIPRREVRFIAEESKQGKKTIISALVLASEAKSPWNNISMTEGERDAAGITEALRQRPGHPDYETMKILG